MAKGFKQGAGGVSPLNFKVVGGTSAPGSPKENTIWVNTATAITSYVFSATQPTGSEGMVWIKTGVASPAAFNALKKNGIQLYPLIARQYVSGVWVDKTAKSYQGGKLVDWINYLYNEGNEFKDITGGWIVKAQGTITKEAGYLAIKKTSDSAAWISTTSVIDFTDITRIEADYSNDANSSHSGMFLQNGNPPSSGGMDWSKAVAKVWDISTGGLNTYKTMTLNTTAIKGTYLVYLLVYQNARFKSIRIYY